MKTDTMETAHLQAVTCAHTLEETAREARAWYRRVGASQPWPEPVRREQILATLSAESEGRHLRESAHRRQCVGIFGPSQVGKSFLVESLGTSGSSLQNAPPKLMVRFEGQVPMDFTEEIAPRNDDESTGLVTRFTADQASASTDPEHPVELKLLSETDLVKLLANAFLSDFDHEKKNVCLPDRERICELLQDVSHKATKGSAAQHLDEVAMFDLEQYFRQYFRNSFDQIDKSGYWQRLNEIGHRLPRAERIRLYAVLWGEQAPITELFTHLLSVLDKLGHPRDVRTSIDAVRKSKGTCIIDVALLKQLHDPRADADQLPVMPAQAKSDSAHPVWIARSALAALTAELKMVLDRSESDLFSHTDILDFPGARSREKESCMPEDREKRNELMFELLRRGKMAYLFQHHTDNSDLSCMLLCVRESTQEVKGLPATVTDWIKRMQGSTPEERLQRTCSLLLVLTRFDYTWSNVDASVGPDWVRGCAERRLNASLGQFRKEDWLDNWSPSAPFRNTYFIRNPKFGGLREDDAESLRRLALMREGLAESKLCDRYVQDTLAAWDAVTGPDGGAGRLMAALRGVLNPTLKAAQLQARIGVAARQLDAQLAKLHCGEDEEARAERQAALKQLVGARLPSANRGVASFYRFLSRLSLEPSDARRVYDEVVARQGSEPAAAAAAEVAPPALDLDDLLGDGPAAPVAAAETPPPVVRRDDADEFASEAVAAWIARVRGLVADRQAIQSLQLEAGAVADLLEVWERAAHRVGLAGQIARRVGPQMRSVGRSSEIAAQRCAVIAASAIDDFLAFNGTAGVPADKRPRSAGRPVFAFPPLPVDGLPVLDEKPAHDLATAWWGDWAVSLIRLGVDNVGFNGAPGGVDAHDNGALGALRARIRPLVKGA